MALIDTVKQYWKPAVSLVVGLGVVGSVFLFPPLAALVAPVVEFLTAQFAFVGAYAGLAALSTTLLTIFSAAALTSHLFLAGVSTIWNKFFGSDNVKNAPETTATAAKELDLSADETAHSAPDASVQAKKEHEEEQGAALSEVDGSKKAAS